MSASMGHLASWNVVFPATMLQGLQKVPHLLTCCQSHFHRRPQGLVLPAISMKGIFDGYTTGSTAKAGNSTDLAVGTLPVNVPTGPLKGSVARAATTYNAPDAEIEVEKIVFRADPGEPLSRTQFFRTVANNRFTRMGWRNQALSLPVMLTER